MSPRCFWLPLLLSFWLLTGGNATRVLAQVASKAPPAVPAATDGDTSLQIAEDLTALDSPELPQRGWNAWAAFSAVYDGQLGFSSSVEPAVVYRLNRHYSADAMLPIYFFINGYTYRNGVVVDKHLTSHTGELGDTTISGHAQYSPSWLDSTTTLAFNAPTGNARYGLSTGRVTYVALNDFETTVGALVPDIQLGFGDNSDLVNRRVQRNYDTLGSLAYFQGGGSYAAPKSIDLQGDAYEQLPLGSQKIYTVVVRDKKKVPLLRSNGNAEDNGVTTSANWEAARHMDLSAYYSRSFRLRDNTFGFTVTFGVKARKKAFLAGSPAAQ
jgi:hypothetical protein